MTDLVLAAIATCQAAQLSLWDALLIEAVRTVRCDRILTEDLVHGSTVRGVRIENPFQE